MENVPGANAGGPAGADAEIALTYPLSGRQLSRIVRERQVAIIISQKAFADRFAYSISQFCS